MVDRPSIAEVRKATLAPPDGKIKLSSYTTSGKALFPDKFAALASLQDDAQTINSLQDALFAAQSGALLVVLQGIDTAGKDGTAQNVFHYTSPLGVRVFPFGKPTDIELAHDYLWRAHQVTPRCGHISVFNRSHYEDVLVVRVRKLKPLAEVKRRYQQINDFERMLTENGVRILKIMLHISREEQGVRLRERLTEPDKRWKFNPGDLEDRKLWDDYQDAYRTMLEKCSTDYAPWHVVPADSRSRRSAIAARLVRGALEDMKPAYPDPGYRLEQFEID